MSAERMSKLAGGLTGAVQLDPVGQVTGFVFDPTHMTLRFVVEFVLDGHVMAVTRADVFVEQLWRERRGDGCYGFSFALPRPGLCAVIEVRVANTGVVIGTLDLHALPVPTSSIIGRVMWRGGLRLTGWVKSDEDAAAISMLVDGVIVHQAPAMGWSYNADGGALAATRSFDIELPLNLADGTVKTVEVFGGSGQALTGSPVSLLAFREPLREAIAKFDPTAANDHRALVYDRLFPPAVAFDEWPAWADRWLPTADHAPLQKAAIAVIGDETSGLDRLIASLERHPHLQWVAIALPSDDEWSFQTSELRSFLDEAASDCDVVVLVRNGAVFYEGGFERLVSIFNSDAETTLVYPDVCYERDSVFTEPQGWPSFDYERFLAQGYFGSLFALRRDVLLPQLKGGLLSTFGLVLSLIGDGSSAAADDILHLPGPVASIEERSCVSVLAHVVEMHLQRQNAVVNVRVDRRDDHVRLSGRRQARSTTAIIFGHTDENRLRRSIDMVRGEFTDGSSSIVVAATSARVAEFSCCKDLPVVVEANGTNRAALLNKAISCVDTSHVCLLDAALTAMAPGWLSDLEAGSHYRDVGCVGSLLCRSDGQVTHAGYVLALEQAAIPIFEGDDMRERVYGNLLNVAHGVSALSMRMAVLSMEALRAVGAFDEHEYPAHLRDVDMCLRLSEAGYRSVILPHIRFMDDAPPFSPERETSAHELQMARFRHRWKDRLANDDYYSPILGVRTRPYARLAWPPRDLAPRSRKARPHG